MEILLKYSSTDKVTLLPSEGDAFFFFFGGAGVGSQVLFCLSHVCSSFCSGYFGQKVLFFAQA
jgi:hypothetical protein